MLVVQVSLLLGEGIKSNKSVFGEVYRRFFPLCYIKLLLNEIHSIIHKKEKKKENINCIDFVEKRHAKHMT